MAYSAVSDNEPNLGDGERLVSLLGGAALVLYGLARGPALSSALLAVGGGLLLQRGLAGHCALYRTLGISSRAPEAEHSTEIERDAEDSFPASDPPSWSPHTAGSAVRH